MSHSYLERISVDATSRNDIQKLCRVLSQRMAIDIVALNIEAHCSWADCLIIATARSRTHLQGLTQAVLDCMRNLSMDVAAGADQTDEGPWKIIDGGSIVVSLMEAEARSFYAPEELWFESDIMYSGGS